MGKWIDRGPAPVCSDACRSLQGAYGRTEPHAPDCPFPAWNMAGTDNRQAVADLDLAQQSALRVTELESAIMRTVLDFIAEVHPELTRVEKTQALANLLAKEVAYLVEDERHP